jgi:hypothetical protein
MKVYLIPVKPQDNAMIKKALDKLYSMGGKWLFNNVPPHDVTAGNVRGLWMMPEKRILYTPSWKGEKYLEERIAERKPIILSLGSDSEVEE